MEKTIAEGLDAHELTKLMLDSLPLSCQLFDSNFKKIYCNMEAVRLFGFNDKKEYLERYSELYPEYQPDGQRSTEKLVKLLSKVRDEGHYSFDWTFKMLDGTFMPTEAVFIRLNQGSDFVILGYTRDLREHKKMMDEIYKHEKELVQAHKTNELQLTKLNLVVQATKIGLWDMDIIQEPNGTPTTSSVKWSDEFRHMLGFSDENDFPNVLSSWRDRLHPDDKAETLEHAVRHLMDKTGNTPYDKEYRLMKKNGEYGYFRAYGGTFRDEDGNAKLMSGALMDITETKNIVFGIDKQRAEAEAANKAKSDFLSTMSHEIRTPMNAIIGITEIQLQNKNLDSETMEAFDKVYVAGDLLLGIINDILDLSKIEAGKLELFNDTYEIASLINDTAQLNVMRIGSKQVEFKISIDENTPSLLSGDELRVKQILNNLLTNAFKYTEEGQIEFSVSAETGTAENMVTLVLRVSDTGMGMTRDQLDLLFEKFTRFSHDTNRSIEGTGLGMNITFNLVRMMNGDISVESEPGKGTVFTVRLPQGRVDSGILGKELAENLKNIKANTRTHMKRVQIIRDPMPYGSVLVVDDVQTNIYVAKGLLAPYGLKIDSAANGFEAVEIIEKGKTYDIIFMDHMMPKMDGIEATKIIRNMGYSAPIIALTANAVAGQADIFLNSGFDDFIPKPIDIRQLNNVLNKLIRDKHSPSLEEMPPLPPLPPPPVNDAPINPKILEAFIRDAAKSISVLESINAKQDPLSDEDKIMYEIHIHGMKSALANIGKTELSAMAYKLEMSAHRGEIEQVRPKTSAFLGSLRELADNLALKEKPKYIETADENKPFLTEKLLAIKTACEAYDVKTINDAIMELREKPLPQPAEDLLTEIDGYLLLSDFDKIIEAVDQFT